MWVAKLTKFKKDNDYVDNSSSYRNAFWFWSDNVRNEQVIIVYFTLKKAVVKQPFFVKKWMFIEEYAVFLQKIVVS